MSKKTTLKRVSLVAVAAMGFGLLSVVPSFAAAQPNLFVYTADGVIANTDNTIVTGGGVAGAANTVKVQALGSTTVGTLVTVTGPTGSIITAGTNATVASGGASETIAVNSGPFTSIVTIATPAVGTITVKRYLETSAGSGIYSTTASDTVTFTVAAAGVANVYTSATTYAYTGDTTTASSINATSTAAFSVTSINTASTTPVASFNVTQLDGNGNALTSGFKTVAVTTTLGSLQTTHGTNVGSYVTANAAASQQFWLAPNGQTGTATVTIAVNGITQKTFSVTFFSTSAATLTASTNYTVAAAAVSGYAANSLATISVVAKDANGNAITSGLTLTASSSNTAVGTVAVGAYDSTNGIWPVTVTGVAPGAITVTVTDAADSLTATTSVDVVKAVASTVTLTLDATTYAAGSPGTATITALDSNGKPIADGTYTGFLQAKLGGNYSLSSDVFSATSTKFKNGIATATFYAPVSGSSLTLTGTTSATAAFLVAAAQGLVISASADVTNAAADAATDAANAATDAANYAADAADAATTAAQEATAAAVAAQESADAATAAVVALGLRVDTLLASVRAQLTSIANLIKRILAKKK